MADVEPLGGELFGASLRLIKANKKDTPNMMKFGGIASSEAMDVQGDTILRKHLDLSYLQRRGYVNWDHGKEPADQLGFSTKATLVASGDLAEYEDLLGMTLTKSVSVYVEGSLYSHVKKAVEVYDILKSIPEGVDGALGLSVEGSLVRNEDKSVARAVVRGLAITPAPVHPDTLCRLVKSLSLPFAKAVEHDEQASGHQGRKVLTFNDAVVQAMEWNPTLTLAKAKRVVQATFDKYGISGDSK